MAWKVGDIVKFKGDEGEVVGIVYENGNKQFGQFRVQAIGPMKYRGLHQGDLQPATKTDLVAYGFAAVNAFTPANVIQQETEEAGGVLPEVITVNPVEGLDEGEAE